MIALHNIGVMLFSNHVALTCSNLFSIPNYSLHYIFILGYFIYFQTSLDNCADFKQIIGSKTYNSPVCYNIYDSLVGYEYENLTNDQSSLHINA